MTAIGSLIRLIHGHTWSRQNKSSRIDRVYLPNDFEVINATTTCLPLSDHNPVSVTFRLPRSSTSRGRGYWKYNASLNDNVEFCEDLRLHYGLWTTLKPAFSSIVEWWDHIKIRIKELAIKHSVRVAKK